VCDEAVSAWAEQEIASLAVRRGLALWIDPLAMTAEEFLAGAHAAARHGELRVTGYIWSCCA
jgi:hypothetical protein